MRKFGNYIFASLVLLVFWTTQSNTNIAFAQEQNRTLASASRALLPGNASAPTSDGVDYDVQIHLLTGSNESSEKSSLPPDFNQVVRRLRASLPFNNYRVAATFLYRVKDGRNLEVRGVAGPLFTSSTSSTNPTFYEFTLDNVNADASANAAGPRTVQIVKFRFGLRMPVIIGQTFPFGSPNATGAANTSMPVINYEPTGINTSISVGEAVPTLIGTITTSRADESYFLVLTIRPAVER